MSSNFQVPAGRKRAGLPIWHLNIQHFSQFIVTSRHQGKRRNPTSIEALATEWYWASSVMTMQRENLRINYTHSCEIRTRARKFPVLKLDEHPSRLLYSDSSAQPLPSDCSPTQLWIKMCERFIFGSPSVGGKWQTCDSLLVVQLLVHWWRPSISNHAR